MRLVVVGASGMLGHKLRQVLTGSGHDVWGVIRPSRRDVVVAAGAREDRLVVRPGLLSSADLNELIDVAQPDVVINCAGVIKQSADAQDSTSALEVNSVFPHMVGGVCAAAGVRLLQLSTDCVFSGLTGNYAEADTPDPVDVYGRSKWLGEVTYAPHLTIRTSFVGRQLFGRSSLVEWFLASGDTVFGYRETRFSGLSTLEVSRAIDKVLAVDGLTGLYHLAAEPINKYSLLNLLNDAFGTNKTILPDDTGRLDRSLDGGVLDGIADLQIPSWPQMISDMAEDAAACGYDRLRSG